MIYKIMACLILLIFYSVYVIKMLQQRREGIKTDNLGKGKKGFIRIIEVLLKICSYIIVVAEIISIIIYNQTINPYVRIIGLIIAALGTLVFIKAVIDMKNNWRAGISKNEKTELVTNGIYGWSRNPAFLGFDLTYIGIAMAFFNIPLLIISIVTVIVFHLQIVNVEEDFLIANFGQEYVNYKKSVNRYFGKKLTRK